jgi:phosphoglycerol transferase MdoB-like AlkP superfamily enzyme
MKKIFTNKVLKNYLIMLVCLFGIEMIFKAVEKMTVIDWSTLRIFLGISIISLFLSIIMSFCKKWIANIIMFFIIILASIYAVAQAGFENFLGVYISINTSSQLGAVKEYVRDYLASFEIIFYIILIPLILLIIYKILEGFIFKKKILNNHTKKENWIARGVALIFIFIFSGIYYYSLSAKFMQNEIQLESTKSLFFNPSNPNIAVNQFGVEMFGILDIKTAIFPASESTSEVKFDNLNIKGNTVTDYTRTIDDSAWEQVAANETNVNYKTLNNYFMSRSITDKNEYTGMFEGKNLIVIMMESVNNILLDEETYPNFAKILNNGWYWENAYSPRNSCSTGNNEMTGMISLYSIYRTCTANVYKNNKYEESIFGLFNNANYTTTSYHDYTEKYYYRSTIHTNMGSSKYYGVSDLGISYNEAYKEWPSDVNLMDKSSEIFTQNSPFMAWITTVSPHQPYYSDSELSKIYYNSFASTGYPSNVKRYMSKLKVLDDSLGELLDILETKGILDDTVIVLYADHYPYGLTNSEISKVLGDGINTNNEVDRTPFVIYNSQLTAKTFTEYTSYVNILPTIANLFNLDYDPRLYMGTDLLSSDYENKVVFADGSWQTPVGFYYASTGKMSYFSDERYTNEEIVAINNNVSNMIKYSNLAIKTNYFEHLYTEKKKYTTTTDTTDTEETNKENTN